MAAHNCFLLFNDYYFIGTKIYNNMALRRKIVFCYSNDEISQNLFSQYPYDITDCNDVSSHLQQDAIEATNSGIVVQNSEHLYQVLEELYAEFESTGKIECNSHDIEQFSRKHQAQKLAEIILNINNQ
ncbi:MAG: hypothetical protein HUK15_10215 [Bacteroidales bacterium]|nr:hypothetical protein [Bacteroidales bacterium]